MYFYNKTLTMAYKGHLVCRQRDEFDEPYYWVVDTVNDNKIDANSTADAKRIIDGLEESLAAFDQYVNIA